MHHSCYRLYAAVDVIMSIFIWIIWWILYHRAEGLIRLQFEEHHAKNDTMIDRIDFYKSNLRSVGSGNNPQTSAEILKEIYNKVEENCGQYYKSVGIEKANPKMQSELQKILLACIILILVGLVMFVILGLTMIITTRQGKASSHRIILSIMVVHILFSIIYIGAALELCVDPRFCATLISLRPMRVVIGGFILGYKPYLLYIIYSYYRDVVTGEYVDELQSSSSSNSDAASTDESYQFDKGLGISMDDEESEVNLKTDDKRDNNDNIPTGILRQPNSTDITKKHEVTRMSNEKRFLGIGWKKGSKGLEKVSPAP